MNKFQLDPYQPKPDWMVLRLNELSDLSISNVSALVTHGLNSNLLYWGLIHVS